jgi:hypothetical protein
MDFVADALSIFAKAAIAGLCRQDVTGAGQYRALSQTS